MTKQCTKCKETKDKKDFSRKKHTKSGLDSWCRKCHDISTTAWRKKNKIRDAAKHKDYILRKDFGITLEEYNIMLKQQDNKCLICKTIKCKSGRAFAVDHDHITNKIRGLLCSNCNHLLGKAQDDVEILSEAIKYLNKYGKEIK